MAIEMSSLFGNVYNKAYSIKGLNVIFSNIIYTSIILSCIMLIIIVVIYPCKKNTPYWLIMKIFFYILFSSIVFLSIHSSIIKNNYQKKYMDSDVSKMYDTFESNNLVYGDEFVKPQINMSNFSNEEPQITGGRRYDNFETKDENMDVLLNKLSTEI